MNPHEERLNDRLEHPALHNGQHPGGFPLPGPASTQPPGLDELEGLAWYLQQDPQIQVTPAFASQLERRMLRRQTELRLQHVRRRFSLLTFLATHRALSSILGACLFVCLLSSSMLALAAQATSPGNPLYGLNRWEQHVQSQFSRPEDQVNQHLQSARDDLKALSKLADANHQSAYIQMLLNLNQHVDAADAASKNVPAGTTRDYLIKELASLKTNISQTLRLLLPGLTFQERLATTSELARVGDTVPQLTSATISLPGHAHEIATISLQGKNLAVNAQLLIDGRLIGGGGTLRHGVLTFEVDWDGNQRPQSLGLLNPDGTAAQITMIMIKQSGNGSNNSNGNGNGNGNKPASTPTPNGNKPSSTPTPHH